MYLLSSKHVRHSMSITQLKIYFTEPSIFLDSKNIEWFLPCILWPCTEGSTHSKYILTTGKWVKAGGFSCTVMHILCASYCEVKVITEIRQPHKTEVIDSDHPVITLTFRPYLTNIWGKVMTKLLQIEAFLYFFPSQRCRSAGSDTGVVTECVTIVTVCIILPSRYIFFLATLTVLNEVELNLALRN